MDAIRCKCEGESREQVLKKSKRDLLSAQELDCGINFCLVIDELMSVAGVGAGAQSCRCHGTMRTSMTHVLAKSRFHSKKI